MRKPIIAITPKTGNGGDEDSKFCYVFPNFINCVSACGGIPIQLSSLEGSFQVADLDELLERVDGVLFSGGPDIHPGLYGEELLDCCGDRVLMEHPTALLVLMRRRYHYA